MGNWSVRITALLLFLIAGACMKDDELWDFERLDLDLRGSGLFILNEGNFTYGNASLSYYDPLSRELLNDVFFQTNALPLGDVAQSMTIRDSLGYIVVNNSGRIYVINTSTFEYVGKITGLTSPRHIHFVDEYKAYVSDLYADVISIVDPRSLEVTGSINTGHPAEQMLQYGPYLYVNCWSFDHLVLVIDTEKDRVIDSIQVVKQPQSMALDRYHKLWILSDGGFEGSPYGYEPGALSRVAAGSTAPEIIHRFQPGEQPSELRMNGRGDTLFLLNRDVYRMPVEAVPGSEPELFAQSPYGAGFQGGFYGLEVDPSTSEIYVSDAIDYVQQGAVYRFRPSGECIDTIRVGISPGAFALKPQTR